MGCKYEVRYKNRESFVWKAKYPTNVFAFIFYAVKALLFFDEVQIRKNDIGKD